METDEDSVGSHSSNSSLRRWNSSPMINNVKSVDYSIAIEKPRTGRTRTFSASMYNQATVDRSPHVITVRIFEISRSIFHLT